MIKRDFVVLLVLFLFSLTFVSAEFQKTAVTDTIIKEFNQPAHFIVKLTGLPFGSYQLYTLNDVSLSPKGYFSLTKSNLDVYVYPTDQLIERGYFPLAYKFTYFLKQEDGANIEDSITLRVVALKDAISIGPDYVDPDSDKVTLHLSNNERAELKDVKVKFTSPIFDAETVVNFSVLQKTEVEIELNQDRVKKLKAGPYVLKAEFQTDRGVEVLEGKIYLTEKKGISTLEESEGFFVVEKTITKINAGNIPENVEIKVKKNILTRLFTSFNIEPNNIDRSIFSVTYSWNKELGPSEILSIKVKTNYVLPVLIIIVAALIIYGFKRYLTKNVDVSKSVTPVRTKTGDFALRVTIKINAKKNLQNVSLVDRVPGVMKVYEKFGSFGPTKFDLATRRLEWELGSLRAGEERILSYVIYSKVGVVGKFSLPEALLVYEKDGNIQEISSNKVFFLSEQIKKEED